MDFIKAATQPDHPPETAWFFIFSDHQILVLQEKDNAPAIPCISYRTAMEKGLNHVCYIGTYKKIACYCAQAPEPPATESMEPAFHSVNFRSLYGKMDFDIFWIAGYARQIHDWNMNFTFCGKCGSNTLKSPKEHVKNCPGCGLMSYPRISPAIIVAVIKEDQILLARGVNFPNKKMFSVLAGFVEAGETLEECVKREVFEETGIQVKQITYFGSQPWPFPDSLMIGFTAAYDSGSIHIDPDEIAEADWFPKDQLPLVPKKPSLSGQLIDWFIESRIP